MVSVCIPTYNGEQYIEAQLHSILPQLEATDEVVISDDHSTDSTIDKILKLNDVRIKVLTNTRKPGLLGNLENALRATKGDIIYLSDQDDLWFPGKVARVNPLNAKLRPRPHRCHGNRFRRQYPASVLF